MQCPTGNKMMMILLAVSGTTDQDSCGAMVFQVIQKILGRYHNQSSTQYVARRFHGSRKIIPLVSWKLLDSWNHHFIFSFEFKDFETFWDPPTFPCLDWWLECCCYVIGVVLLFEYHDDLAFGVSFSLSEWIFSCIACMICYNLVLSIFVTSAQFSFGATRANILRFIL